MKQFVKTYCKKALEGNKRTHGAHVDHVPVMHGSSPDAKYVCSMPMLQYLKIPAIGDNGFILFILPVWNQ
jgi:hypothetical protein